MKEIVFIDGSRTPFLKSGSDYMDLMSYQLGQYAISGLLSKTGIDPGVIDRVIMGTVIANLQTSNVAREAATTAGVPNHVPCDTVTMACISANRAICNGIADLHAGQADVVLAGGVDNTSDSPIGYTKKMRKKLFKAQKLKTTGDMLRFASTLRPSDFLPDRPKVAEFSTGRVMGADCDIMAARFQVSRKSQDEFAARSHQLAHQAWENGQLGKEVQSVIVEPKFGTISRDNGIRGDTTAEKIAKLRPAFDRKFGTLTAANSSFLTDGAAVCLLTTKEKAADLGLPAKARIVDYVFTAQDIRDELLLGPTFAVSKLLQRNKMSLSDFDVIEFHEAFAGQILANIYAMASTEFAQKHLGRDEAVGQVDMSKFNLWGGSLAIGHPFGATGARLLTTTCNRLHAENGRYGLLAACAAGAHGHAMIVERI